ncbi:TMV resistance protein N-like [Pyrus ussuriensis x Pyrus communis]|uniref:TMV resistance protein N-like n=1 Tax=Pyrus ussuriensis x Pyrus communis TaxID=2448454 RepID=A0A5N5GAL5_9ROSA|nr:TMV resistance protein N-like [Pyrus ussuriensis x Pyrus communis]
MIHQKNQLLLIAKRRGAGDGRNVSKLLGDFEDEVVIEHRATSIREGKIYPPKAFSPPARMVQTSPPWAKSSKFDPSTGKLLHFVEDNTVSAFRESVVPKILMVLKVTSPRASLGSKEGSGKSPPHLVCSSTEERIKMVSSDIQKLEEQLAVLKAEHVTLLSKLQQQIEGVKKANMELEDVESQLINNNIVLVEPTRIFTLMQTYYPRIITLGENVHLLG